MFPSVLRYATFDIGPALFFPVMITVYDRTYNISRQDWYSCVWGSYKMIFIISFFNMDRRWTGMDINLYVPVTSTLHGKELLSVRA